jgi:uncharacterized protein (TIGR02099 family)
MTLRSIGRALVTVAGSLIILLALALGLFRMAVPELPQYKPQIEAWASKALGSPLRVGSIDARLGLSGPQVLLNDAEVLTADGSTPLLTARSVTIVLSPLQMISGRRLAIKRLLFDGVGLIVERSADGEFSVLGRTARGADRAEVPLEALPQGMLHIRDAQVDLIDHATGARDLRFTEVRLDVERKGPRLEILSRFELPEELGDNGHYTLERIDSGGPEDVELRMALGLENVHLEEWAGFTPDDLLIPRTGNGDISLFLATKGAQVISASGDVDMRAVGPPVAAAAAEDGVVFDLVFGHFEWSRHPTGWQFNAENLQIVRNNETWPETSLRVERVERDEGAVYYANADFVRLEDLIPFEPWLPGDEFQYRLGERNLRGDVRGLNVNYVAGSSDNFSIKANIQDVGLDPLGDQPGIDGVTAELAAQNAGGRVLLQKVDSITIPGFFREPISLDESGINISWTRSAQGVEVRGEGLRLANPDLAITGQLNLSLPQSTDGSPYLDLKLDIPRFDAASKGRYLPLPALSENLLGWLDSAIVEGQASAGKAVWRGALGDFPFEDGGGEFKVEFLIENCTLQYANGWPPAENLRARIAFVNAGMDATVMGGTISGNDFSEGRAVIPDLRTPVLELDARTSSQLERILGFAGDSPLIEKYDFLRDFVVAGDASVDVTMNMPIREREKTDVRLVIGLDGADVGTVALPYRFENLSGDVVLADGTLQADDVSGMLLGKPVRIDMEADSRGADPATLMIVNSWADARSIGVIAPLLERHVEGETDWYAVARFPVRESDDPVTIRLRSVLGGLALKLPEPLAKSAVDVRDFEIALTMHDSGLREWDLRVDDKFNAILLYTGEFDKAARGAAVFGGAPASVTSEPGLHVSGSVPRTRLESWLDLGGDGESEFRLQDFLRSVDVQVEDFGAFGLLLGPSRVELEPSSTGWAAEIDSENVAGVIAVPYDLADGSPLVLDMQRLRLVDWETSDEPAEPTDPSTLPAITVNAEEFVLLDRRLGVLDAKFEKTPSGLLFRRFDTNAPGFSVRATGAWTNTAEGPGTTVTGALNSTDLGSTLEWLGHAGYIEGGRGNGTFDLNWRGGPDRHFAKTIAGRISVQLKDGVLQDVNPGAGRAVGLLSVTALPRRLSLDFTDVFGKGLAFDKIEGDFTLSDGNAYTSNLIMDGPAAGVRISGRVGIEAEDYDQTAIVHAKVGSSLPIVGTVLGGPPLGLGLWIFSEVFKEPLKGIARAKYSITGSWIEPVVERQSFSPAAEEAVARPGLASGDEG